jgi:NAD(P)-dependent dehydrogenase (short-subunit alcohol dehydrogenase family)
VPPDTRRTVPPMGEHISFGLAGRVCVVTGAARGIGEACARRFVADGARPVIVDVDDERGLALADELDVTFVRCDVGDREQVEGMVGAVIAEHGRIDVLVNNAGIFRSAPLLDLTEADFDEVLRVNLKGAFLTGQAVAREMVRAGRGAIVNMSSVNSVLTIPAIAGYNVSKGGLNQLTRVMALDLADKGVRVNAVAPGTIATEMARASVLTDPEATRRVMSRTPMGRFGEPSEVADVVAFLASDAASYLTGEIVFVDGGRLTLNYTVPA